jgi:hypothetical protein
MNLRSFFSAALTIGLPALMLTACSSAPVEVSAEETDTDDAELRKSCTEDKYCRKGYECSNKETGKKWGKCVRVTCTGSDGETYRPGQSYPAGDGCNTCTCTDNGLSACTKRACPVRCTVDGKTYNVGDTFKVDCNTCTCTAGGMTACTKMYCPPKTCSYDGNTYNVGESFPSTDGCNTCTCGEGGVGCTKRACTCNPDNEPNRKYLGDAETCMRIRYACDTNTTPFSNSCGCGCEQDSTCPEWINCMPGPGVTDCAAERARCPLSQVAY